MEETATVLLKNLVRRKIGYGIVQPGDSKALTIPVVKVNNLISGLDNPEVLDKTTETISSKYSRTILRGGELLISVVGTIGRTAIVPMCFAGCNIARAVAMIDIQDSLLALWVKYYIDSPKGQSYIIENLNTTVQPTLNIKDLESLPVPIYEREELERRVRILQSLDSKIALNTRINHNLEEQAHALYKSWFIDYEPFIDGELVDSEMGRIPKGWNVRTLGEVTKEMRKKVGLRQDIRVLSPITTGQLVLSEEYFTKQVYSESISKYLIVQPQEFAYNPARVNIGSIGKNNFSFDGCVSPVYVVFRCESGYEYFFDLFRRTDPFKDEVVSRSSGGVRQTLGYKDFALIKLVYPPQSVIASFNEIYKKLLDGMTHCSAENLFLVEQREVLLPKLMSGELI